MVNLEVSQPIETTQTARRKPFALSNWKMAMTVPESLAFVRNFQAMTGGLLETVEVVLCPPYTALYPVAQILRDSRLQLGAQNMAASTEPGRTGEISAPLLVDIGCRWVMLGHWEVRRNLGDENRRINKKVLIALEAGLNPILLIGPGQTETASMEEVIFNQ